MRRVLIRTRHGLGDAVQLTAVLRHVARYWPSWRVDVASLVGKHTAFGGLCERSLVISRDAIDATQYEAVYDLDWHEADGAIEGLPSTKAERALREVFGLTPRIELCGYSIATIAEERQAAGAMLATIAERDDNGRYGVVVVHFEGNTSGPAKNLAHHEAARLIDAAKAMGYVVLVLDWDGRSRLVDGGAVHCAGSAHPIWGGTGTGSASVIAAIIAQCAAAVVIDSGPGKCAAATETPQVHVWREHHPYHYVAPNPAAVHVVPHDHERLLRGDRRVATAAAESLYTLRRYATDSLAAGGEVALAEVLREPHVLSGGVWCRAAMREQDEVIVRDVLAEDCYGVRTWHRPVRYVLDVGAHIGTYAIAQHVRHPDAAIVCVEACRHNWEALARNVAPFAGVERAAMWYGSDSPRLLNAVYAGCKSTGGSWVGTLADAEHVSHIMSCEYRPEFEPLKTVTIEDVLHRHGWPRVDVLKLDCEGSEFDIIANSPAVRDGRVSAIVGEYHGAKRFAALCAEHLGAYAVRTWRQSGDLGLFMAERRP